MNVHNFSPGQIEEFVSSLEQVTTYDKYLSRSKHAMGHEWTVISTQPNQYLVTRNPCPKKSHEWKLGGKGVIVTDIDRVTKIKDHSDDSLFVLPDILDNVLHFIYDTLPLIALYWEIKRLSSNRVLLVTNKPRLVKYLGMLKDVTVPIGMEIDELLNDVIGLDEVRDHVIYQEIYDCNICYATVRGNFAWHKTFFNRFTNLTHQYVLKNYQQSYHDKIYISRRPRNTQKTICNMDRRLLNETELVNLLASHGFIEVHLEDYPFTEKIAIMQNAKEIVMQSSAVGLFLSFITGCHVTIIKSNYTFTHFDLLPKNGLIVGVFQGVNRRCRNPNVPWSIDLEMFDKYIYSHLQKIR